MIKASPRELQLHFSTLQADEHIVDQLIAEFSGHLLSCLHKWYGPALYHDTSLADEAVFEAIKYYQNHPRNFNPEQGSLLRFLELCADRTMQKIFLREKIPVQLSSIRHILAKCFDNDRDVQLGRLIIKNKKDLRSYAHILNIGGYQIDHQLSEIRRHTERIKKTLESNGVIVRSKRITSPTKRAAGNLVVRNSVF